MNKKINNWLSRIVSFVSLKQQPKRTALNCNLISANSQNWFLNHVAIRETASVKFAYQDQRHLTIRGTQLRVFKLTPAG